MSKHTSNSSMPAEDTLFRLAMILTIIVVASRGFAIGFSTDDVFEAAGPDGIMRLMSVRDLLAGQAWYDMTQYRVLPDDGLSLHWSRYVDFCIGAIIAGFALVLPMPLAEQIGGVLWPVLVTATLIVFTGFMVRKLFGSAAAAIAMVMVLSYPPLSTGYFDIGQLDHHNVQILLMTFAVLAFLQSDRPIFFGVVAGLAGAMSLAIGLETLFLVLTISLTHVYAAVRDVDGEARKRLSAYCAAILAGLVLFLVGQTPPSDWLVRQCDELSTPYIAVGAIGAISGVAGLIVTARGPSPAKFIGAVAGTAVLGLVLAWPLVGPCLQSPYGNLPIETQELIATRIQEAQPLHRYFQSDKIGALSYYGGALVILILATFAWARDSIVRQNRKAAGYLIFIGWFGFAACFWQIRQVVVLAATVPALTGYVVAPFLVNCLRNPNRKTQLTLMAVALVTLFQTGLLVAVNRTYATTMSLVTGGERDPSSEVTIQDGACSEISKLQALDALPPTQVLASINLGPMLIMATHHSALAAPYHRSNAALTNASAYDVTDAATFLDRLSQIGASAVVVCEGTTYGSDDSIGSRLARGDVIDGLTPVPLEVEDLLAFVVQGAS